ncbi:MAG: PAS domain-containing protein, partial [Acidobacteriota bacterium]|nr:PAS domain-containing protein [Acidobacteriota bacterium]
IREAGGGPRHVRPVGPRRWAALLLAAAVAVSGAMRLAAHGSSGSPSVIAFLAAAVLASLAWPLSPWLFAPFGLGLVLGALPPRGSQPGSAAWRSLWGIQASVLAVVSLAASGLLLRLDPSLDLGSVFFGTPEAVVLRVSLFTLVIGSLRWIRGGGGNHLPSRWGLVGMAVLMIAAAIHGWTLGGLALLLLGTYFAVAWAKQGGWSEPGVGVVTGCLLAALIAAIAWELAYHQALERRLRAVVEDELAPPSTVELEDVAASAAAFFDELALESLTVGDPQALEPEDLAFAVWRQSPLAQIGRLSRVVVGPPDAPLSSFAYGVPAARVGQLDDATQRRTASELPGWEGASIVGRGSLTLGAGSWTTVEYRLFLRPGFRSGGSVLSTLAEGLLRRRSDLLADLPELPADVLLGVYGADGSVLVPPWKGAVDLQRSAVPARLLIPGGWARTFVDEEAGVKRVLLLPIPTPLTGIERVATHAAGPLILVLTAGALWFVFSLSEVTRRRAVRLGWRSFSTRLVVLYTVLLIVPIVLINVLVLRVFAERLEREQRAASEAALESAQRILGDYVFSLEPGFGLETAVGDDVLVWLSHVVHHEVNLYWGSRLSASSKGELFSSGLLPQRIPGEVFARIALEGADLASRTTRAGGAVYEEFYAPLEAPGAPLDDAGLFVSTPLLAQEVAAAEDMAAIRRRVLLAGAAVALLLALLGRRVGTSFTRPLLKIVEGTQAIAAGAPSIEVEANDSELVTLVDAIDEMAQRIAAARSELLREKQVVDRMIDNITSGVVSVDHLGRVLLLNRTAHELLGITIGESLTDALGREDRLASVAAFVTAASDRLAQKTVSLSGLDDNEAEWTLIWVPLAGSGEPAALFVIEDVTEVLRGQRLEAWAEMARMIAHEVKNPLTPIRLSTEHLREVWRSGRGDLGRTLDQCTSNILRQVGELQQIVSDFSAYSRIPAINPRRGDLADLVERVVDGYRSGGPPVAFERLAGP